MEDAVSLYVQFPHEYRDLADRLAIKRAGFEKEPLINGGNNKTDRTCPARLNGLIQEEQRRMTRKKAEA